MLTDKELKKKYLPIFSKDPEKYYPVQTLKKLGYARNKCKTCKRMFWSVDTTRRICGDPACNPTESFGFIGNSPAKNTLSYIDVWKKFSQMFKKLGYTPIKRYPIVARWNPTMEYTNASIAAFQPHVIAGEAHPPATQLTIPQFCFRTVDIDNVGITGSHNTVFNMIGQHAFVSKKTWDQEKAFTHIHQWLEKGLGLDKKDIIFHEDSWAGGGNLGCCMEFFSHGCELGNQVYMLYEQTATGEIKELALKVLDMGMGMERNAWFSQGSNTVYDATFPDVLKKLLKKTKITYDKKIVQRYVPLAGKLNIDEVEDINKAWHGIAKQVGVSVHSLQKNILPLTGIYSVAEHARALLILLSDGALPSNTGGGYNIRSILRRALDFIDKYEWNIDLRDVCAWHAEELKPIFPELSENLSNVQKIVGFEIEKYESTKQKSRNLIKGLLQKKKTIGQKELLKLYDERGITPELINNEAKNYDIVIDTPGNFYALVSDMHEKTEQKHATKKETPLTLDNIPRTNARYFEDYAITKFTAKIVYQKGKYILLDQTYFYPTSGGQLHDIGTIAGEAVKDIIKQKDWIVHVLEKEHKFPIGEAVNCIIDKERREQLAQHHTSAHILNAAARKILGPHINQASAYKDVDKARLDITHYQALTEHEIAAIEKEANKIISDKIPLHSSFMDRDDAEQSYGVNIYQGGVAPGKQLRIVDIAGVDVEACGGTHLHNTFEAGMIKILKSNKVSDSIVRIEYVAGNAAGQAQNKERDILAEAAEVLGVNKKSVALRSAELFKLWKDVVKKKKNIPKELSDHNTLEEETLNDKELLEKTAHLLKTQKEHIPKTLRRFKKDLDM